VEHGNPLHASCILLAVTKERVTSYFFKPGIVYMTGFDRPGEENLFQAEKPGLFRQDDL
jgi:hypothetical protein